MATKYDELSDEDKKKSSWYLQTKMLFFISGRTYHDGFKSRDLNQKYSHETITLISEPL